MAIIWLVLLCLNHQVGENHQAGQVAMLECTTWRRSMQTLYLVILL
jgi:hypothetical protein